MKTLRRSLAYALLAVGLIILGAIGAWVLVDDATLVSLLVKRVESLSDTRIGYQEGASISRTWAPELRINRLAVDDAKGQFQIETRSLRLQISLPELLRGRLDIPLLSIGDTRVNLLNSDPPVAPDGAGARVAPDRSLLGLSPVLHDLQISPVTILANGERSELPAIRVRELSLRRGSEEGQPELSAQLAVQGATFIIDAKLPDLERGLRRDRLPFEISIEGAMTAASATGRIDLSRPSPIVDAELRVRVPDLDNFRGTATPIPIPGDLTAKAELRGPIDELALEGLSAQWRGPAQSNLQLQGRIANVLDLAGIDLALTGWLSAASWLQPLFPTTLGALESAELSARLAGDRSRLAFRDLSLKARTADELNLSLAGRLELGQPLQTPSLVDLDLKVAFDAPTTRAARVLIFDDVPELGTITATGDMRSTDGDLTLENMIVKTTDGQGVEVHLRGGIERIPLGPDKPNRGYDLQVAMKATKASVVARRVGLGLPLSGPLNLACRIQGETQALQVNQIKLSAGDKRKTLIGAEGRIQLGNLSLADPLESLDLALWVKGRNTDLLSAWTGAPFPAVAYHAKARLHTVSGRHRVDDYELATEKGEPLEITERGSVDSISFLPEFRIEGIRLDHRARTNDVASLSRLFRLDQTIPPTGPADLRLLVSGDDKKLLFGDLRFSAGREKTLLVEAAGRVGYISAANKWRLRDTDIAVKARSSNSQAMAGAFGYSIPPLGPVSAQARIYDRRKTLGVHALRLVVGDADKPALNATGSIGDLYKARSLRLEAQLNLDGQKLARFAVGQEMPELAPLTGRLLISDDDGRLGMDSLRVESIKPDVLSLKVDGRFDDFARPETFGLNFHLRSRDAKPLTALLGWEWSGPGNIEIDAQLKRTDEGNLLEAIMIAGKEKVDMLIEANFQTSPPRINGRITAHNFFLPDLAETQSKNLARTRDRNKKSKKKGPVFSREPVDLSWMKKADLDLLVDIKTFDRAYTEAVSAQFPIKMKAGRLSVESAYVVYPKGRADLRFQLDGREHPKFDFTMSGEKLDLWRGLKIAQGKANSGFDPRNAELNLDISLASSGKSPHEMASNAQGKLYMTMKHGRMRQTELRLLFVDIVGWVSNKAKERYEDVYCAVADYSIQRGLVSTNAFFMDLDTITVAGEGTIDLGKERVDYTFLPRKKSRLIASADPVTIKGPLSDPSVKALPLRSATLTFGQLVLAPYIFVGRMAAERAEGELDIGGQDSTVCEQYERDLEKAREKKTGTSPAVKQIQKEPAKKRDRGSAKQSSPFFYDD